MYHLEYMYTVDLISILSSDLVDIVLLIGFKIWWHLMIWVSQVSQSFLVFCKLDCFTKDLLIFES